MLKHHLSIASLRKLEGVHPDLVRVTVRALQLSPIDFTVIEGKRNRERQAKLFKEGKSQTLDSLHLTGDAVDLGPIIDGMIPWEDKSAFEAVADAMKDAADELGVLIEWGGDWTSFYDGPHFQRVK